MKRHAVVLFLTAIYMAAVGILPTPAYADDILPADEVVVEDESLAGEDALYVEVTASEESLDGINFSQGVSMEMGGYKYWLNKTKGKSGKILMNKEEIASHNKRALDAAGTNMNDLEAMQETYDAGSILNSLKDIHTFGSHDVYVDFEKVDKNAYFNAISTAIAETGYKDNQKQLQYALAVKNTTIDIIPERKYIGYSAKDSDDENTNSALNVNEPFVIKQRCLVGGEVYYWGYSNNCTGWVYGGDLAICKSKAEWLDAWKVDLTGDDFIIIAKDKIVLEPSVYASYSSEVKLTLGTILKEVPEDKYPAGIEERGTWNNYLVYLPTRDASGQYVKCMALISQHEDVQEGFLDFTKENVLRVAFSCLGDRYGWGGMLDAMDCSLYTRNIYKCFGLELPRNTSWQQLVPDTMTSLAGMSDEEKLKVLKDMPAGTLLYMSGHTMVYLGMDNKVPYVISATGSLADAVEDSEVLSMNSVILNSLYVKRRNGTTWLNNITAVVCPQGIGKYVKVINPNTVAGKPQKLGKGESLDVAELVHANGKMKYIVSDKRLAKINKNGVLIAKQTEGKLVVTGYMVSGKNLIKTGSVEVTVE